MTHDEMSSIECTRVELEGTRYVILRESVFAEMCRKAGLQHAIGDASGEAMASQLGMDNTSLPEKLIRRRKAVGLSQAGLARRAGIRAETLNRIERGRTTPDFATVRKLVVAMNAAEQDATNL